MNIHVSKTIPVRDADRETQLFSPTAICAVKDSVFVTQKEKHFI
jgi:hypothetical protein